ncbi:hypothetical protein HS041_04445 [Planomonospora sp. ID67723]|uniref:hypothetical protein n=1 Tax=Planomonospora sp. ID67723 TaxID=2738134 RepID=UPI0018C3F876|nr:hypothetical protein [Planomonospora sp. ID67723]MBG0827012.1 hypothetical protein [Planomonospora sp. ID67723]
MLGALPEFVRPGAEKAPAQIWNAEDETHALTAVEAFRAAYGAEYGETVVKVAGDVEELLAFYDFPAVPPYQLFFHGPAAATA